MKCNECGLDHGFGTHAEWDRRFDKRDSSADLLELAASWCDGAAKSETSDAVAGLWRTRAKMLRDGYQPLLTRAALTASAVRTSERMIPHRVAPVCDEHGEKGGGARSGCPYCVMVALYAALSKIDYLCGEPNDMEMSGFDVHCNEQAVVEHVRSRLTKSATRTTLWPHVPVACHRLGIDFLSLRDECERLANGEG